MFNRKSNDLNHRLDEIMRRLDDYEARLTALEQVVTRHSERGRDGKFVSAKGAVKRVEGSR